MTDAPKTPPPSDDEIEDLVFRCLESDDPEATLRHETEGQPELREVAGRVLERVRGDEAMLDASPTLQGAPLDQPSWIGPYRILREIGVGGMGSVYLAEQREPVRRRVAIKVIKLGMDSRQILRRFELERQALALMNQDNIARVHDAGATERGQPYFVMEYVPGPPLNEFCDRHKLDLRARLELVIEVCRGVQHAHQKGIIHRDLKPQNILVAQVDGRPVPKIIDFGLARAADPQMSQQTLYTEHGQVLGTPEYMSPEQLEGDADTIDTRTDIYALGVILYELLSGHLPVPSEIARSSTPAESRDSDPLKPSTRFSTASDDADRIAAQRGTTTSAIRSALRGDLDWIVMTAMDRDRARRYATAHELAADIGRFLANEPVLARPPSATYRLRKFVSRNRGRVAAAASIALAGVLWLVTSTVLYVQAEALRVEADERATEANQVADFLVGLFREANPRVTLGRELSAERLVDLGARRIRDELADQPRIRDRLLEHLAETYDALGERRKAISLLREALASYREHDVAETQQLHTRVLLARMLSDAGEIEEALGILEEVHARFVELDLPEHPTVDYCLATHGRTLHLLGRHLESRALLERSLALAEKRGAQVDTICSRRELLAAAVFDLGRHREAQELLVQALAERRSVNPRGFSNEPTLLANLARSRLGIGDRDGARAAVDEAVTRAESYFGADSPIIVTALLSKAHVYRRCGEIETTIRSLRRALAICKDQLRPDHPDTAWVEADLGCNLIDIGDNRDEARRLLASAVDTFRGCFPDGHVHLANALVNVGDAEVRFGDREAGVAQIREAIAMLRRLDAESRPLAGALRVLGYAYIVAGDFEAASKAAREALGEIASTPHDWDHGAALALDAMATAFGGDGAAAESKIREALGLLRGQDEVELDHPDVARAQVVLGRALELQGRREEAEAHYKSAIEMLDRIHPEHPFLSLPLSFLAASMLGERRFEEARPILARTVALRAIHARPHDHWYLCDVHNYGLALQQLGEHELAADQFALAIERRRAHYPSPNLDLGIVLMRASRSALALEQFEDAVTHARGAVAELEGRLGADADPTTMARDLLGVALTKTGAYPEAEKVLLRAHEAASKHGSGLVRECARHLAELYDAWDRGEDAERWRR